MHTIDEDARADLIDEMYLHLCYATTRRQRRAVAAKYSKLLHDTADLLDAFEEQMEADKRDGC